LRYLSKRSTAIIGRLTNNYVNSFVNVSPTCADMQFVVPLVGDKAAALTR